MRNKRKERISELDRVLGEPRGAILYMMLVMLLPYFASRLNIFVDGIWVADLGPDAITAVSVVKPLYIIISCVGVGFGIGASACISYQLGRGNKDRAETLATTAVLTGISISIGVSLFLLFCAGPIMVLMGAEDVKQQAEEYMLPLSTCASILVSSGILTGLLKAEGAAKKVLISTLIGAFLNMILDPLLIFEAGLGIAGAAWATAASSLCTVLIIYYWYHSGKMHLKLKLIKRPDKDCLVEIFGIASPRAFEELCSGIFLLVQRVVIIMVAGMTALMVHNLAFMYLDLVMIIPDALGSSILTVGSIQVGRKNQRVLNKGVNFTIILALSFSFAITLALFLFPDVLMSVFINSETEMYYDDIIWATRVYSILVTFYILTKITSYLLQVIRKSKVSATGNLIIGFTKSFCYCIPLIIGVLTIEAVIWSVVAAYVSAALIMIAITIYEYRKFDINTIKDKDDKGSELEAA